MATKSAIEWTEVTWNPVTGCDRVAAGCDNCYALALAKRLKAMGAAKYQNDGDPRTSGPGFGVTIHPRALAQPLRWRTPKVVFVNSMSDLFHDQVTDEFILDVWQVMRETPRHNYQILTKRPERMAELVSGRIGEVLPNVWLGTSIENAEVVDRIDDLRRSPAAIRFISFEPLIGAVGAIDLQDIHWAIVGGESGKSARPIREEWIDEIHAQCLTAGTAFFFKQWGTWGKDNKKRSKKANGREYRGRTWDEMPAAPQAVV